MSDHRDVDEIALDLECAYCCSPPGVWCVTKHGRRATTLHDRRTHLVWEARSAGYGDGHASGLNYAAAEFQDRREGNPYAIRRGVPLVGLDVIAWIQKRADWRPSTASPSPSSRSPSSRSSSSSRSSPGRPAPRSACTSSARRTTMPNTCDECARLKRKIGLAQGELIDRRRKLTRYMDDPARRDGYLADIKKLQTSTPVDRAALEEHEAAPHPDTAKPRGGSALGGVPTTLPPATDLAGRIQGGEKVADLAEEYGVVPQTIRNRLNNAGWSAETGQPHTPTPRTPRITETTGDITWQGDALCAQTDPEAFYPEKGGSTRDAKAICNGQTADDKHAARPPCPVRDQCLKWALDNDERFGIWGGLSERERRKLKKGSAA